MAAPTPTTYIRQIGHKGIITWNALWSDTTNLTVSVVIDLSAQGSNHTNSLRIERIAYVATAGIEFTLLFDATSNQTIYTSILGNIGSMDYDFTWGGREGIVKTSTGSTGDLVISTTSAADADEITLVIWYYVD